MASKSKSGSKGQSKGRSQGNTGAGKGGKQSGGAARSASKPVESAPASTVASTPVLALGVVLLAVAAVSSLMLALQSLGSISLPGCGFESDCARAAASVWGKVPGVEWLTTANIGLAYFTGLLVAWITSRGALPGWLRWIARVGALVSILLAIVMIAGGYVCAYCMVVHFGNVAFVVLVEWACRTMPAGRAPAVAGAGAGAFVLATVVLAVLQAQNLAASEKRDQQDLDDSVADIIKGPPGGFDVEPDENAVPFIGRYRKGPESAPIRIVIISDFQCPDCNLIEEDVRKVVATRPGVSISHKHFPFCVDCNWKAAKHNLNLHPNACWAARASEAAGILGGNEGFWRMHEWLFDVDGSFVDAELNAALPGLGFDPSTFIPEMMGERTLDLVKADIDEALDLGLRQTPMIFINGRELRGWRIPNALPAAVEKIAATNPPPLTAAADRPPKAFGKYIEDWQLQPVRRIAADASDWSRGKPDALAQVVVWGDYQEPITAELDGRLRAYMSEQPEMRYSFRHYPIDLSCNASATRTIHPLACRASQAVEAAGRLGGIDAYWKMHEWAFANIPKFNDANLRAAATGMDLDADALFAEMESPEVAEAIRADAAAAKALQLRGVPFMFVNNKQVPFWKMEGQPLPERIIWEAVKEAQTQAQDQDQSPTPTGGG